MEEYNITEHNFVPKHLILDEKDVVELLKEYNISIRQLPRIFVTDPVAKALNAKKGDVIKIIRKSPSAKEAVFYRVVVNA
ncbi:DNA-directed RNA polymerase subunit H [Candidatus Woesearchaeota archaeon]|nr:DNA-directed RNA polymerase subunit H [Candidatus Woesearchaeota archaeon]